MADCAGTHRHRACHGAGAGVIEAEIAFPPQGS